MITNPIILISYSLIKFLRIRPYCDWNEFRDDIKKPMGSGRHKHVCCVYFATTNMLTQYLLGSEKSSGAFERYVPSTYSILLHLAKYITG